MIYSAFVKPLCSQRYFEAVNRIKQVRPSFFIDFGCAEADFIFYVSRHPDFLSFAVGVDKDETVIKKARRTFQGGAFYRHSRPFGVSIVQEDIAQLSQEFLEQYRNCPFVTCLELIEHLTLEQLEVATNELFGKLQPNHVYLTTPNIEYNNILTAVYDGAPRSRVFRHPDHKFEWTRDEFAGWCEHVCSHTCVVFQLASTFTKIGVACYIYLISLYTNHLVRLQCIFVE